MERMQIELPDGDGFWVKLYLMGGHTVEGPFCFKDGFACIATEKEFILIDPQHVVAMSRLE
jgi:hypothetical protein